MMDTSFLKGSRVNTDFGPGIVAAPQAGVIIGAGGPWQVEVLWDDGETSVIHVEDVVFE